MSRLPTAAEDAAWTAHGNGDGYASRPEIEITTDEEQVADKAIDQLARRSGLFQRGGVLCQIVEEALPPKRIRRKVSPAIVTLSTATLREMLASSAQFVKLKKQFDSEVMVECHPPDWLVSAVAARGKWEGVPPLEAIVETPVLTPDGRILRRNGYDSDSGLFFYPSAFFPDIPASPGKDEAVDYRDQLLEVVEDFPFATEAHKSVWLAAALTPAARFAYSGPSPMFSFDANTRGCGKSYLVDCISMIHQGREMSRSSATTKDEEMRKQITSILLAGERMILWDNIAGTLGCASLDAVLTATTWKDRLLGLNKMSGELPVNVVMYATGNNIVFGADTSRRTAHCRLESKDERPEERTGFQHPDLLAWVRKERAKLAIAAVGILRAFIVAKERDKDLLASLGLKPWGSFDGWSNLVRAAVVWVGMPDPGETRQALASTADRSVMEIRMLIAGWEEADPEGHGITVSQALELLAKPDRDRDVDAYPTLRNAIAEITPSGQRPSARSIGMKLHHLKGRNCGGKAFDRDDSGKVVKWKVVPLGGLEGQAGLILAVGGKTSSYPFPLEGDLGDRAGISPASGVSPPDLEEFPA